jgi:ribokinase
MGRVASFGSINIDRVANVDGATLADLRDRYDWFPEPGETRTVDQVPDALEGHVTGTLLGGKGANQAVAAARAGGESRLFGKVGRDEADHEVLATIADRGVDVSAVGSADVPTGTAYVFVGPDGENYIAILAGANAAVDPAYARDQVAAASDDDDPDGTDVQGPDGTDIEESNGTGVDGPDGTGVAGPAVTDTDVLLLQNEVPGAATEALLDALAGDASRPTVILDPAPAAGAAPLVGHPSVDVVTPNESEGDALAAALSSFDGVVIRTRGPRPVVVDADTGRFEVTPPPASAVDTTGAGDVFAGYLAAELATGANLRDAVERACAAASLSVEQAGVQRATPDRSGVRRRMDE